MLWKRQRRRQRWPQREAEEDQPPSTRGSRRLRPARLARRLILILLAGAIVAIGIAPQVVSLPYVQRILLRRVASQLPGTVQIGRLRLGWLRPLEAHDLRLLDGSNQPLAQVQSLRTETPLWRLVTAPRRCGVVHLEGVELALRIHPGGSNWEDLMAALPPAGSANSPAIQIQLRLQGGNLHIQDTAGGQGTMSDLEGWLDVPTQPSTPWTFAAAAVARDSDGAAAGKVQVQGSWSPTASQGAGPRGAIQATLDSLPLDLSRFVAVRYRQSMQAHGRASGHLKFALRPTDPWPIDQLTAELTFSPLQVIGALTGTEALLVPTATCQIEAAGPSDDFQIQRCNFSSPLASASLKGQLRLAELQTAYTGLRNWIAQQAFAFDGQLDVAALAGQMPKTFRVRDDVQLTAGVVRWEVANQPTKHNTLTLTGHVESEGLEAARGSETIRLRDPIQVRFRVGVDSQGPFAEELVAEAPFLLLELSGRLQQGRLEAQSDLTRLTTELGQFFDLGPLQAAGEIQGRASWQTTPDQQWTLGGELRAEGLLLSGITAQPWLDRELQLVFNGVGRFDHWQLTALDAAAVQCRAGSDEFSAQLSAPVTGPGADTTWPLDVRIVGDLNRWRSRIAWALPQPLPTLAGQIQLQAKTRGHREAIFFEPVQLSLQEFELVLPQQTVTEPTVELAAQGVYHIPDGRLVCHALTLASTAVSLKADALRYQAGLPLRAEGDVQFRSDLEKLWRRLRPTDAHRPRGQWTGRAELATTASGTSIRTTSQIDDFQWQRRLVAGAPAGPETFVTLWQEPRVDLELNASWPADGGPLQIAAGRCQTPSVGLQLSGNVAPWQAPVRVDLSGSSHVNWDQLNLRLRPWLGANVQVSGMMERPFRLRGPLGISPAARSQLTGHTPPRPRGGVPPELEGEWGVGWQRLQGYGIVAGAGALDARLSEQTLLISPLDVPLSQGRLRFTPQLELFPPFLLRLQKGSQIERLSITPPMCRSWLKYVAPIVADATTAEGLFSIRVAHAELPLTAPRRAQAGGSLSIHQAHVGPGPLSRDFLTLAQTVHKLVDPRRAENGPLNPTARWIELPEQVIPFRVEEGRVVHQNLTMQIGEVTMRTRGSVSFNQQLALVVDVPILDRWVANQPYLAGLRGQTLSIPVRGTLQQPSFDQRALQAIAQQAVRGAATGFLQQELQRQLEDLLRKK